MQVQGTVGLTEETAVTDEAVLQIWYNHSMVNRWNKAITVRLEHNYEISFITMQCKTMAIVYTVTDF